MGARKLEGDPFDALGDPNRRAIVEMLRDGGRSVQAIADEYAHQPARGLASPGALEARRTVVEEPQGKLNVYRLDRLGVEAMREYMETVWGDVATRFRLAAENTKSRPRR